MISGASSYRECRSYSGKKSRNDISGARKPLLQTQQQRAQPIPSTEKVTDVTRAPGGSYGTLRSVVTKPYQSDYIDWDKGRDGYVNSPTAYVPNSKPAAKASGGGYFLSIAAEERFGSLIAAAGTIWAAYVATVDYAGLWRMQIMPPGPVEVCILGVLAWLHAKLRRSTKIH